MEKRGSAAPPARSVSQAMGASTVPATVCSPACPGSTAGRRIPTTLGWFATASGQITFLSDYNRLAVGSAGWLIRSARTRAASSPYLRSPSTDALVAAVNSTFDGRSGGSHIGLQAQLTPHRPDYRIAEAYLLPLVVAGSKRKGEG